MKDLNEVTLIGNLGTDAELKTFENGGKLTRLNVATNRSYKDRDGQWQTDTEWHTVVVRGQAADRAAEWTKGQRVLIRGSIQTRKYQGKDGQQQYITEIVVAGPAHYANLQTGRGERSEGRPADATPPPDTNPSPSSNAPAFDDDIPF